LSITKILAKLIKEKEKDKEREKERETTIYQKVTSPKAFVN
jgi:hypothetical protein